VGTLTPYQLLRDVLLGQQSGCGVSGQIDSASVTFYGFGWNPSNGTWNQPADSRTLSYFSHGTPADTTIINGYTVITGLGMESGLLLCTGKGREAEGPNTHEGGVGSTGTFPQLTGDPDLSPLVSRPIKSGAKLEFNFVPLQSEVSFDYIFASEEYPFYVFDVFNDVFGFWIWEVDNNGNMVPGTKKNIALLPDKSPVSINNVNWGYRGMGQNQPNYFSGCPNICGSAANPQYFVPSYNAGPYQGKYMEFNGRTVVLKARADVIPYRKYHLKLAVANVEDDGLGSGVFLRAGSLDLGTFFKNIEEGGSEMNNIFEGCEGNVLEILFPPSPENTLIEFEYSGYSEYIDGIDGPMPTSYTSPPQTTSYTIPYKVLPVTVNGGEIKIKITLTTGSCDQIDSISLYAFTQFATPTADDIVTTFACTGNTGSIKVNNITGGSQSIKMSIDKGVTWKHISSIFTNLAPGDYTLMIMDSIGCDTVKIPVTIHNKPVLSSATAMPDICTGKPATYTAACSVPDVNFTWTRAAVTGITQPAGSGSGANINETLTNTTTNPVTVTYKFTLTLGDCINTQDVTVVVHPAFSQSNPTGAIIPFGTSHTINLAPATGSASNITYLWQQSTNGTTWTDAALPNNTQDYTTPALTKNTYFRRLAILNVCKDTLRSNAAFIRLECQVSYNANPVGTGVLNGAGTFFYGDTATVTASANYCYQFKNWSEGTTILSTNPVYKFEVTKNHALIANFEKIKYPVTLNIDPPGAGLAVGSGYVDCGTNHNIKANASQCYVFSHWSEAGKPDTYNASDYILVEGPRTLTAHFLQTTVNVTFNVLPYTYSGTVPSDYLNIFCNSDVNIYAIANPKFIFSHWEENGVWRPWDQNFDLNVKRDYALTAVFEPELFNVIVYPNDYNAGLPVGTKYNIEDGTLHEIFALPFEHYNFINWTVDSVDGVLFPWNGWDANPAPFPVHQSWTLFANFELKKYKITVEPRPTEGGLTTTDNGNIYQYYQYGDTATVTAVPNPTYRFVKWIDADTDSVLSNKAVYTFPVTKARNLFAIFEHETYCITLKPFPEEAGWVYDGGCNISFSDTITVHARAYQGWEFDVWKENNNPVCIYQDYNFEVTGPRTLVAHFKRKCFDIKVAADPAPGGQVFQNAWNIPYGTDTAVYARALPGYVFVNWTEGTDTVWNYEDFHFIITYSRDLVAHFERKKYNLEVLAKPPLGGIVWENGENITHGTDTAVYAMANQYFTFQHWETKEGTTVANGFPGNFNRHPFAITRDTTWVAHFKADQFLVTLTADPPEGGTVSGGGYHDYLSDIIVTATPDSCHNFLGWFEEKEGLVWSDPEYPFTVTGPLTLIAMFELKKFDISTAVIPNRAGYIVMTEEGDRDVPCGEEKHFEAFANVGYIFGYWTVNGTVKTENPFTITMSDNLDVVAYFSPLSHEIKLFANSIVGGSVSIGTSGFSVGVFPHNFEITANATPKTAHKFVHWIEEDTVVLGAGAAYKFKVVKDRELTAVFDSATYRVTTVPQPRIAGWTEPEDTAGLAYQSPVTIKAFANPNFTFKYWMENNTPLPYPATHELWVTRDHDLIAVFEAQKFNILVDVFQGGGDVSGGGYNLPYLTETYIQAVPDQYHDFFKWTDEAGAILSNAYEPITVLKSKHFYAHFTPKKYDIVVWPSPSNFGNAWDSHFGVPYGDEVTIHAQPKDGYVFIGWYEGGEYRNSMNNWTITVTGNRNLEARFEKGVYHLTLIPNPEKGGTVSGGGLHFEYGDIAKIVATPLKDCYSFKNWTDESGKVISSITPYDYIVKKSDTLTANFIAITSKITLLSSPYGAGKLTADGHIGGGDIAQCDTIMIVAEEDGCHTFDYWAEADTLFTTDPSFELAMDKNNRTFVAHFTQHYIDVTVKADPPEGGGVSGDATNLPCGEKITLIATPNKGYHLVNWTKNGEVLSTDLVFQYKTTETCEVVANFKLFNYNITLTPNPIDMGSVSGGGYFDHGQEITVHATPLPGNMFVNWTENGKQVSKLADYKFTVTANRNLVANFDTTYYIISVRTNDSLLGTTVLLDHPTGIGRFAENEPVTAIAYVTYGYQFLNWTIEETGDIASSSAVFEFPATQSMNLVATFYALDFDTYAATLWQNTFMLDLKKLAFEGYQITGCKWLKNNKQEHKTNTIDEFSYSAGPKNTDLLETDPSFYHFHLTTKNGSILYSTKKIIPYRMPPSEPGNNKLLVYPNPAESGMAFTVENVTQGTLLQVYNQFGVCVKELTTNNNIVTLTLNLPAGIYLIRNENKEAKVIIAR